MRVVIDANVIVSALINERGAPNQVMNLWREERFRLIITSATIDEVSSVLRYTKVRRFHQLSDQELDEFIALLEANSELVLPTNRLHVSVDDDDNHYIECAVAGKAQYLITGDKRQLLPIKEYQGIRILSPTSFLALAAMDEV